MKSRQTFLSAGRGGRPARRRSLEVAHLEDRVLLSDTTVPTTAAAVVGRLGNNGIYVSPVTVNLSATDPDDSPSALTTQFSVNGGAFQTGNVVSLTSDGIATIQFRSTDPAGNVEATKSLTLEIDRTAPTLRLTASPTSLWPPNGKSATIRVSGVATDNLSGVDSPLSFRVRDEYGKVQPRGEATVASNGRFNFSFQLVSSRLGQDKNGRQYTLFVTVQDDAGNRTTRSVVITVPHDQGHHNGGGKGGTNGRDDHGPGHGIAPNHDDHPKFDHKWSKSKHANHGGSKGKGRG